MPTLYLRETTDARFTNKGSKITNAELDGTFIGLHDLIDALEATIELSAGAVIYGVQDEAGDVSWNGTSPQLEIDTTDSARAITLPTATCVQGYRVTIIDDSGNANSNNITISTEGSEQINGSDTLVISSDYGAVTLAAVVDNGGDVQWRIIATGP